MSTSAATSPPFSNLSVSFVEELSGIAALRSNIKKWLSIPDEDDEIIDFILAVYVSHRIPGDPLWGIVVDASGAGKTEYLRAFRKRPDAYFLSTLTEKTLVSGYRDPSRPDKDPSLLPELNEKVLVIKDLSPLLSMRRESRNTIISDFRDAYDGFTDQGRGNLGKVGYESRFTLLTAATLAIDRTATIDQELGERFIKFRARGDGSKAKVRKAISNIGADESMRGDIGGAITRFLDTLPKKICCTQIPEHLQEPLAELADFTARARSHVARDRNGNLQYMPRPEVGTRLGKELGKLLLSLAVVRGKEEPDDADLKTVRRVADDCLPPNRLSVIEALRAHGAMKQSQLEDATRLPHATMSTVLGDLKELTIVKQDDAGWSLA